MIRPALSIVTGFIVWTLVWLAVNLILIALLPGAFADDGSPAGVGLLVGQVLISIVSSAAAGFVTARILRSGSYRGVLVLACLLLAVGVAVQMEHWDVQPLWSHLVFLVLLVPSTLAGGWLAGARRW